MSTSSPAPAATTVIISDEAMNRLKACFDGPRWAKIEAQATKQAESLQGLCMKLLATSTARHPDNPQAALYNACNRLLIAVGSALKDEDRDRYAAAVNPAAPAVPTSDEPATGETTIEGAKKKRGGKADPAPPPAG